MVALSLVVALVEEVHLLDGTVCNVSSFGTVAVPCNHSPITTSVFPGFHNLGDAEHWVWHGRGWHHEIRIFGLCPEEDRLPRNLLPHGEFLLLQCSPSPFHCLSLTLVFFQFTDFAVALGGALSTGFAVFRGSIFLASLLFPWCVGRLFPWCAKCLSKRRRLKKPLEDEEGVELLPPYESLDNAP